MFGSKNKFSEIVKKGYYFDCCIDLDFFDSKYALIARLKTPQRGYKPDITVRGAMIEGEYAISSSVSVRNLAYDIDINNIAYIFCRMYYAGLETPVATKALTGDDSNEGGHKILFSVIYADQENEPPNRAVRFQCVVSAVDYTRQSVPVFVNSIGEITSERKKKKADGTTGKGTNKRKLDEILQDIKTVYNDALSESNKQFVDALQINQINYYKDEWKDVEIEVTDMETTIIGMLRYLNSLKPDVKIDGKKQAYKEQFWKIYISNYGTIEVQKIEPRGQSENKMEVEDKWYKDRYLLQQNKSSSGNDEGGLVGANEDNPVPLNYVKSAYRNEVIIYVTALFDDRIKPGCYCAIKGNAVMGKVGRGASRITQYKNTMVVFRITGAIEYEFGTVRGGSMKILGPVIKEVDEG